MITTGTVRIEPDGLYDDGDLYRMKGIPSSTMSKARGARHIRYTRKGNRILYLGQWIIDWLKRDAVGGEPVVAGAEGGGR